MENNKHCEICVLRDTEQCPDKENKNLFCGSFRAAGPYSETLKATTRITGWLAVFMAWLVLGTIASLVIMLACCTDTHGRLIALASVPYVFLGFYVLYAFYQRKPDAVALAKGYLVINCAVYVFGLLIQDVLSLSSSGVSIGLAVNIAWFVYLTYSQKVKEVIPVEYRKIGKVIWIVVGALVVLISVACVWETTVGKRTALRAELLREIEIQNRSCPIDNGIVEITTIKLQGDTVVYYCWVKEDYQGEYLKSVIASPEYKKTLLLGSKDMMQGEDLGYFLRRYGVAMKYVYDFGDDEIDVVLTMDDIKQMANQVPESEEESFFAAMKSRRR